MANTNDVIVLDAEKYPQIAVWGEKLGTQLGLEYFHLADEYFDYIPCLLYTSPSPRDATLSRMPSSA